MLRANFSFLWRIAPIVVFSLALGASVDDEDAHSCTLLQVSSNLQVHARSSEHTKSGTQSLQQHIGAEEGAQTTRKPLLWLRRVIDGAYAFSYWIFFLYIILGLRPTLSVIAPLLTERKLASEPKKVSRDGSFEASTTRAEVVLSSHPMQSRAGLLDILSVDDKNQQKVAIIGSDSGHSISYEGLRAMVEDSHWEEVAKYDCVVVALGPGIELATTLMSVMARTKCAPVDPNLAKDEAVFVLRQFGATCVVLNPQDAPGFASAAASLKLTTFVLERPAMDNVASFRLCPKETARGADEGSKKLFWNGPEDVVLLLRTSGTTGKSKVVPLLLRQVVQGARAIATSMKLGEADVCLNAMPLFHIGGISCNMLAVLASHGSIVCFERRFDPHTFASLLSDDAASLKPTWYYATPSMHLAIVDCAGSVEGHSLRLVRSGAAALTPALQERIESLFECVVLATCSMTECMPVASPLLDEVELSKGLQARVQPLGSVGKLIGPSVEIHGGEIMLRGSLVTLGYWGAESGWKDGLFATGDLGHIDKDGFLWLTGRKKEVINQGGETIAPQELEEPVLDHVDVKEVVAYPVLHERLGEAVALAIHLQDRRESSGSETGSDLQDLAESISSVLAPGRRPVLVAFVSSLSRTSTGKVQRLKNPWCSQIAGKKTIITGEERQMIVLDARNLCVEDFHLAKRITPEAGTLVSMMHVEASSGKDESQTQEMYDSLGLLQNVGIKENFEVRLALQLYVLGLLGITIFHLWAYSENPALQQEWHGHATPGLAIFILSIMQKWHLHLFFIAAGYLDSQYSPTLGARDVATYALVVLLPLGECLGFQNPWSGFMHPARWFLFTLLMCRLHMSFQQRYNVPKLLYLIIGVFSVNIVGYLLKITEPVTCDSPGPTHTIARALFSPPWPLQKFDESVLVYLVGAMWLPDLARVCATKGPRTRRGEKHLGLTLWIIFILWIVSSASDMSKKGCLELPDFEVRWLDGLWFTGVRYPEEPVPCVLPDFRFIVPMNVAGSILKVCLLAAAMAYLPLALPDLYFNASFGALLLMPLHQNSSFQALTGYCLFEMKQHVFVRIFLFLGIYSIYFAVLGYLCQMFVGKVALASTACLEKALSTLRFHLRRSMMDQAVAHLP